MSIGVDDPNDDDLNYPLLAKTAALRILGAMCTCTAVVTLAFWALDTVSEHSFSRAAGFAEADISGSTWLPVSLPQSDRVELVLFAPAEAAPRPVVDSVAAAEPSLTPAILPAVEAPPPTPAPPPRLPIASAPPTPAPSAIPQSQPPAAVMLAAVTPVEDVVVEVQNAVLEEQDTRAASFATAALAVPDAAASVPLPTPAPKRPPPPPTPAQRLKLDAKERAKAEKCLAEAVYFEARSEAMRGQIAVAQVVMNRVFSPFYPNDVCGVVYQNAHRRLSCQFTFACDGIPERITDFGPWRRAKRIAKATLDGKIWLPQVAKSTHYHAAYVRPVWVREMKKMARHGLHTFYRPRRWGDGSRETNWSNITHIAARAAIVE